MHGTIGVQPDLLDVGDGVALGDAVRLDRIFEAPSALIAQRPSVLLLDGAVKRLQNVPKANGAFVVQPASRHNGATSSRRPPAPQQPQESHTTLHINTIPPPHDCHQEKHFTHWLLLFLTGCCWLSTLTCLLVERDCGPHAVAAGYRGYRTTAPVRAHSVARPSDNGAYAERRVRHLHDVQQRHVGCIWSVYFWKELQGNMERVFAKSIDVGRR